MKLNDEELCSRGVGLRPARPVGVPPASPTAANAAAVPPVLAFPVLPVLLLAIAGLLAGCMPEDINQVLAPQVKAGMSYDDVRNKLGMPDKISGVPTHGSTEKTSLFYGLPDEKYLEVHFIGDRVSEPPTSVVPRHSEFDMKE